VRDRPSATGLPPKGLVWSDYAWGAVLLSVLGLLVLHNFWWGGGELPQLHLGPLRFSNFGLLAGLDVLFGVYLIRRWCLRFGLDWPALREGLPWIVGLGYVLSHLVSIALYSPAKRFDVAALLDLGTGISSFGGIFGGGLVAILSLRRRGLPVLRYGDPLAYGFVGGYIFGRAGCFAIHDHPGRASDFFLAVEIDGVRRHDLGFYEMWLMLALFAAISLLARRRRPADGSAVALAATFYSPVRFLFDFLRIGDVTYAGLTPGQWLALPLFAIGLWAWSRASWAHLLDTRSAGDQREPETRLRGRGDSPSGTERP
jgi:phosphatidylglycerol:prolipoprotein diacylglycerol transferase